MYQLNKNKLNAKIVERGMTKDGLAKDIGVERTTLYRRLKRDKLLLSDVHAICRSLQLSKEEACEIFLSI